MYVLALLELLSPGGALVLPLGAPGLGLGVGLAQVTLQVGLALLLLLELLAGGVKVGVEVPHLGLELLAGLEKS